MRKIKGNNIRLGLFVVIGTVLLIIGIYFIGKKQQLFGNTFRVSGMFKDISGLLVGNNVRFSGINIGVVENIQLVADTAVKVDMLIDEKVRKFIKKDAKAIIGSDGLMGNKLIIILPGTSNNKIIENNDFMVTTAPVNIDDILANLETISGNAAVITYDLAVIMDNIRTGRGTIGKLFMDTAFAENIDQSIINIKQGTGGFKENMDAASNNFLLRGFFKNKEKEQEKAKEEKEKKEKKEKEEKEKKDKKEKEEKEKAEDKKE